MNSCIKQCVLLYLPIYYLTQRIKTIDTKYNSLIYLFFILHLLNIFSGVGSFFVLAIAQVKFNFNVLVIVLINNHCLFLINDAPWRK